MMLTEPLFYERSLGGTFSARCQKDALLLAWGAETIVVAWLTKRSAARYDESYSELGTNWN